MNYDQITRKWIELGFRPVQEFKSEEQLFDAVNDRNEIWANQENLLKSAFETQEMHAVIDSAFENDQVDVWLIATH